MIALSVRVAFAICLSILLCTASAAVIPGADGREGVLSKRDGLSSHDDATAATLGGQNDPPQQPGPPTASCDQAYSEAMRTTRTHVTLYNYPPDQPCGGGLLDNMRGQLDLSKQNVDGWRPSCDSDRNITTVSFEVPDYLSADLVDKAVNASTYGVIQSANCFRQL